MKISPLVIDKDTLYSLAQNSDFYSTASNEWHHIGYLRNKTPMFCLSDLFGKSLEKSTSRYQRIAWKEGTTVTLLLDQLLRDSARGRKGWGSRMVSIRKYG
jgi:hypothetical protein